MKDKANEIKQTGSRMLKNLDELLAALALTVCVLFTGYHAWQHYKESMPWLLLLCAAVYAAWTANKAWKQALDK